MGKSKSVPDLAGKPMVTWTSDDVKLWLKEHESLNKYTKQLKVRGHLALNQWDCSTCKASIMGSILVMPVACFIT